MKSFKLHFVELFTVMAWISLFGYIFYCTVLGIKSDSVRDAWNVIVFIAGYVWARSSKENGKGVSPTEGTTTAEISATITQEPITNDNSNQGNNASQ